MNKIEKNNCSFCLLLPFRKECLLRDTDVDKEDYVIYKTFNSLTEVFNSIQLRYFYKKCPSCGTYYKGKELPSHPFDTDWTRFEIKMFSDKENQLLVPLFESKNKSVIYKILNIAFMGDYYAEEIKEIFTLFTTKRLSNETLIYIYSNLLQHPSSYTARQWAADKLYELKEYLINESIIKKCVHEFLTDLVGDSIPIARKKIAAEKIFSLSQKTDIDKEILNYCAFIFAMVVLEPDKPGRKTFNDEYQKYVIEQKKKAAQHILTINEQIKLDIPQDIIKRCNEIIKK